MHLGGLVTHRTQIYIDTYACTSINNPTGGGHGEIGFHLAKQLAAKGVKVTILNDQYSEKKEPFKVG